MPQFTNHNTEYPFPAGGVPHHSVGNIAFGSGSLVVPNLIDGSTIPRERFDRLAPILTTKKHSHYFKDVSGLSTIDVYRVLDLFGVTNPCIQHAVKKLLVAGGRGAGKDIDKDIKEAVDSLVRYQEMKKEDSGKV